MTTRLLALAGLAASLVGLTAAPASAVKCRQVALATVCHYTFCDLAECGPPPCMADGMCIDWDVLGWDLTLRGWPHG